MTSYRFRWVALLTIAMAGALLLSSCGEDGGCPAPKVTYPNRETPQGLLDTFAKSLEDRNLAGYELCLWESYRFLFDPVDWDSAGVTPEEPYWGLTEDIASTGHMFAASAVKSIRVDLQMLMDFTGPDTLLTAVMMPIIDVTIQMHAGEEWLTKQVRKSRLHFVLRPDPQNEHLWVIRRIQEEIVDLQLGQAAATEGCTFGSIKAIFK